MKNIATIFVIASAFSAALSLILAFFSSIKKNYNETYEDAIEAHKICLFYRRSLIVSLVVLAISTALAII